MTVARKPATENPALTISRTATAFALLFASLGSSASASNWAHWRGPTGNGTAPNASPPTEWSSTKNVKWKAEVPGQGLSSPIIWENQVFVTTAVGAEGRRSSRLPPLEFKLLCFDRSNGKLMW